MLTVHATEAAGSGRPTIAVIVCAYNEAGYIAACLHTLIGQRRLPDDIVVVDNASTDGTGDIARAVPGVRVVREERRGLVRARETGALATSADLLLFLDADCRAPREWIARVERRFDARPRRVALSGTCRFYDWHLGGRLLIRAYDLTVAPLTHLFVKRVLRCGVVFYGGNFAVRRAALDAIGGFDTSIEFHGEDTNLGRRLATVGDVALSDACFVRTSARRYRAMGTWTVLRLYVRNFWSELLRHRPADATHLDVRGT
ncbi:MAG: glycosyltransferase family 2 protein [Acidobacteria bacterium]|nr:glycosyltransferase family 2 protein [Acidobacteriota bacterium]